MTDKEILKLDKQWRKEAERQQEFIRKEIEKEEQPIKFWFGEKEVKKINARSFRTGK